MLAAYLTGALICASALAAGQAAMALCGRDKASPLAPALGLALLVIVANLAIKLPGRATTAWIALAVLLVASIAVLVQRAGAGRLGRFVLPAVLAALLAAFVVSIPFLVNGRVGPLGQGLINDDMASHLLFTDWVATHAGRTPDLISDGYPLGPHALVAAVAKPTGASYVEVFAGLTLALAALAGVTAYAALDVVRPLFRVPAAVLGALPYLVAAWLAQGAFKEPMLALFLIGFALGLRELEGSGPSAPAPAPATTGLVLGLIAAGTLYAYSFPGLVWLGGTAVVWGLLAWRHRLADAIRPGAIAVGIVVLAAIPEFGRLRDFASFGAFDPEGAGPKVGLGNLRHALNPLEGLSIWPASDFRLGVGDASVPEPALYLGGLVAAAALAWGILALWRRREAWLAAALIGTVVIYLGARISGTPYTSAKALVLVAAVGMLVALRGLLSEGVQVPALVRRLRIPLLVAFVIGAAVSSFLPLRSAAVGPPTHADELMSFRSTVGKGPVLYLGRDQFAAEELFHARLGTPVLNHYNQKGLPSRFPSTDEFAKLDWDALTPAQLDAYPWAITTTAAYTSEAPPNWRVIRRTPDYLLWQRIGPTPPRTTLVEPTGPVAGLGCDTPAGKATLRAGGTATVFPGPVITAGSANSAPRVTDSHGQELALILPRGRWAISLQYVATQDAHLQAPGLDAELPASLDFRGPSSFWPAGEVDVAQKAPVRFTFSVDPPTAFGRLIGAESVAFPLQIAATPIGPHRQLPVAKACGRYVDFITPG
ncbi:MAG: hypothetical protein QOD60_111 [Solirubrobacterales bacterium]|nr:hypothetical protein [Solirubrobacterales bacterium]